MASDRSDRTPGRSLGTPDRTRSREVATSEGDGRLFELLEEQTALLRQILEEIRRQTLARARTIDPKWLTVADAARYCGMSEKWVRSLEPSAPRGLFGRVKGTVFVSREKLDQLFEGRIDLEEI